MTTHSSAIHSSPPPLSTTSPGLAWGALGILAFSVTVPITRIAVSDGGLSPLFVGASRAAGAAVLAAIVLGATRSPLPHRRHLLRLAVIAAGVVLGFPLLTSFALTTAGAGHGAVVIAVLPAATAVVAVLRTGERPSRAFWFATAAGAIAAVAFAAMQAGGLGAIGLADLLLFGAVGAAAVGYAEGGLLARELGAWQTICWALVVAAPVTIALSVASAIASPPTGTPAAWASLAYLTAVSMFLGFFAWYRGLAIGPMTTVSQVQLVQPVLSIAWAALLLGEPVTGPTVLGGLAVIACAAIAVRSRFRPTLPAVERARHR